MKNIISEELKSEITNLKSRALKIGYKNVFPKFPKEQHSQKNFENLMIGFHKRLDNWKNGLLQLENPGGLPSLKKEQQTEILSVESFISGQFVINSLDELSKLS